MYFRKTQARTTRERGRAPHNFVITDDFLSTTRAIAFLPPSSPPCSSRLPTTAEAGGAGGCSCHARRRNAGMNNDDEGWLDLELDDSDLDDGADGEDVFESLAVAHRESAIAARTAAAEAGQKRPRGGDDDV